MPVTTGMFVNNETKIYSFLTNTAGLNTAAACGVLANIEKESTFNHAAIGDSGTSYGLCQWHNERWDNLRRYCSKNGYNYQSVEGQMRYLLYELKNSYKSVWSTLTSVPNTAQGSYDAASKFCTHFERPADKFTKAIERGNRAKSAYYPYYALHPSEGSAPNLGEKIVSIARGLKGSLYTQQENYRIGQTNPKYFDCSGFVYYCYNQAGKSVGNHTSERFYVAYKDTAKVISTESEVRAGDLLFYKDTVSNNREYGITHIAIANGSGGRIHATTNGNPADLGTRPGVQEVNSLGNPDYILRLLSDHETPLGGTGQDSGLTTLEDALESAVLSAYDKYSSTISDNLSRMTVEGFTLGRLIDLETSDEFKFYVPEFQESAGANWSSIDIVGRSVNVLAYNNTSSRKISISLDLYAGAGLYDGDSSSDVVGKLHSDANFVKSLEYPDYSAAIIAPPHTVQLILGSAINLVGVISGVTVEHMKPFDDQKRSMYLKVSFTVTQTAVNPPDYLDIRKGNYHIPSTENPDSIGTDEAGNNITSSIAGGISEALNFSDTLQSTTETGVSIGANGITLAGADGSSYTLGKNGLSFGKDGNTYTVGKSGVSMKDSTGNSYGISENGVTYGSSDGYNYTVGTNGVGVEMPNGDKYTVNTNGRISASINGNSYALDDSGLSATIDGDSYRATKNGVTARIDGKNYVLNTDGSFYGDLLNLAKVLTESSGEVKYESPEGIKIGIDPEGDTTISGYSSGDILLSTASTDGTISTTYVSGKSVKTNVRGGVFMKLCDEWDIEYDSDGNMRRTMKGTFEVVYMDKFMDNAVSVYFADGEKSYKWTGGWNYGTKTYIGINQIPDYWKGDRDYRPIR